MVGWLKNNRIPCIMRERINIDWLYKLNVVLAYFIKAPNFENVIIYRFEDENKYLHMDLVESEDG